MARSIRSSTLETRAARLRLPVSGKPVFVKLAKQIGLGYRRNRTAGTWVARVADGKRGNWTRGIGSADDFEEANGSDVLDFWQAQDRARSFARDTQGDAGAAEPITVAKALDRYEADLRTRGGDLGNVARVRTHMTASLARKPLSLLNARDLRGWRDTLAKVVAAASVNRTCTALKAALNLAADQDERITSRRAWEVGLSAIPNAEQSRNVILDEETVRRLILAAREHSPEFGLLVEVAAVTGARVSQLARLEAQDLQNGTAPRLMIPASRKGRGPKAVMHRPVPISLGLADRLAAAASGRAVIAPLLVKPSGDPWRASNHAKPFKLAVERCGLDPAEVTIYALRHSSIVRQLLAGVPVRVVAVNHDTSVLMIERTYSRYIGDHADALARGALLDT